MVSKYLGSTNHLQRVKFFLDLLGEKGREAGASGRLATAIVLGLAPCVVELNAGTERNGFARLALRNIETVDCHEVFLAFNSYSVSAAMAWMGLVLGGSARGTRRRRVNCCGKGQLRYPRIGRSSCREWGGGRS